MESQSHVRTGRATLLRLTLAFAVVAMVAFAVAPAAPTVSAEAPGDGLAYCAEGVQFIGFSDALNRTTFGGFAVKELSGSL